MSTKKPAKDEGHSKRDLTIQFCDISGFTNLADKMSPTEVAAFLSEYFDHMNEIISKYKGTFDKTIGDAFLCYWGHPIETENHALLGTLAGLEMTQAVDELGKSRYLPVGVPFDFRIGINTGPTLLIPSQEKAGNTALGEEVNLASRIEAANRRYGTRMMISDSTYEKVKERIFCRKVDTLQKGKYSRLAILYEPLGMRARGRFKKQAATENRSSDREAGMGKDCDHL